MTEFGGNDWDLRVSPWVKLDANMQIRHYRPALHRPVECPKYRPVYRPEFLEWEGACYNFDFLDTNCIFCNSCPMSNAFSRIPFDVRFNCDKVMGW